MPDLSLDWYLFLLRLAFIVLLYLFLYQVVRVTWAEFDRPMLLRQRIMAAFARAVRD